MSEALLRLMIFLEDEKCKIIHYVLTGLFSVRRDHKNESLSKGDLSSRQILS